MARAKDSTTTCDECEAVTHETDPNEYVVLLCRVHAAAPRMRDALWNVTDTRREGGRLECCSCGCEIAPEGYCGCAPGSLDRGDMVLYQRRCDARAILRDVDGQP